MTYEPKLRAAFRGGQASRDAAHYVRERMRRRRQASPAPPTVARIADPDNLIRVYYAMKARAGKAPGPDGFTYADWGRREAADIFRGLADDVRAGDYRPGPTRPVAVPKPSGGSRTLRLADLCDRVAAAALREAMEPTWETVFVPWSMGFRPGRGVWRMLAEMEIAMHLEDRWTLATDDVAKAFDNVIVDDVVADHARRVADPSLLSLIGVVLRGGDDYRRRVGIDQGSAYSPLALNVRLHHAHDLGFTTGHPSRQFRYADNVVYLCRDASEGLETLDRARRLLEAAGFSLKGEDGPPKDLTKGEKARLLGFTLSREDGGLKIGLGDDAWVKLEQGLEEAHTTPDPPETARQVVRGWAAACGPAFESLRRKDLNRALDAAARHGFREIGSRETVEGWWRESWERWRALRERVRGRQTGRT